MRSAVSFGGCARSGGPLPNRVAIEVSEQGQ